MPIWLGALEELLDQRTEQLCIAHAPRQTQCPVQGSDPLYTPYRSLLAPPAEYLQDIPHAIRDSKELPSGRSHVRPFPI